MNLNDLKSKKILLLGFGVENIAMAKYLSKNNISFSIADKRSREDILTELDSDNLLIDEFLCGENYMNELQKFEVVFRTPGIAFLDERIQSAIKSDVIITSQIKFFLDNCKAKTIGITGTKGKGTTSTLIYKILEKEFENQVKVLLGGNIGNPPIDFLDELDDKDVVVLELSSFQLQDLEKSPNIAVVLDIKSDHLDVHKSHEEYVQAKTNIVRFQKENDFACINLDYFTSMEFASFTKANIYWFSRRKSVDAGVWVNNQESIILRDKDNDRELTNVKELILRGEHNWENICAASLASYLSGAKIETISTIIEKFPGLEHRLEFVNEINGIKFYNDSFSTTPDTAIAAINSFSEPIILIAGGSEKNADYGEFGREIAKSKVKVLIAIGKTGPRIVQASKEAGATATVIDNCQNLDQVFDAIKELSKKGDIVLLSPASASFDWFKNYKDRGEQFKQKAKAWR